MFDLNHFDANCNEIDLAATTVLISRFRASNKFAKRCDSHDELVKTMMGG